ncbi:MAG: hypothetical protein ACREER_12890 [Alphaproteobacteria bacterium]
MRLWNDGAPAPAIARRLGLTRHSIESKLAKLRRAGAPLARRRSRLEAANPRALRRCLHCGCGFPSAHIGNRICPTCLIDGPYTSALV